VEELCIAVIAILTTALLGSPFMVLAVQRLEERRKRRARGRHRPPCD
jgi:hypothetical protein